MSALRHGIPRALPDHRRREGHEYRRYLLDLLARIGPVPDAARPTLKEAGRLMLDIERLRRDQDASLRRGRRAEARRIDRRLTSMRTQLLAFEARLEVLAGRGGQGPTVDELLARVHQNGDGGDGRD